MLKNGLAALHIFLACFYFFEASHNCLGQCEAQDGPMVQLQNSDAGNCFGGTFAYKDLRTVFKVDNSPKEPSKSVLVQDPNVKHVIFSVQVVSAEVIAVFCSNLDFKNVKTHVKRAPEFSDLFLKSTLCESD